MFKSCQSVCATKSPVCKSCKPMATKLANEATEGNTHQIIKNLDEWRFSKVSIDQLYKRNIFRIFPKYVVNDFKRTITLKASNQDVSIKLLTKDVLKGFIKRQHRFMHLGLVQIAIKPLIRDGLGGPIVVCLRDARISNFVNSLLAIVESDLSQGPFYFNCFPSFSVSLADVASLEVLTLRVKTGGIPIALTFRVVCKAMEDLSSDALKGPILGETTYFQPDIGIQTTIKWDEVQVPESWISEPDPQANNLPN